MCGHLPFTFSVNGIHATTATTASRNLIDHHFRVRYYDCLEGGLMLILTPPSKIRPSFGENVLTDQKSLQKVLGWRIIYPYTG